MHRILSYNMEFLLQDVAQDENCTATQDIPSHPLTLNRSTGSPDSLRSDTSSDCPNSIKNTLQSLQHQAAIITDTKTELEKPGHSYVALISMALLSSPENRMVLGEIYEFITKKFPYYNNQQKAWRNSIRYNLSINECFIKAGRADNGKGNYWSIHPACVEDFSKGDFRRRQARRRALKGVKNVNRNQFIASEYHCDAGYVPMTSSSLEYQSKTLSPAAYQPVASTSNRHQPMTSPFFEFQADTSHTRITSPFGYRHMESRDFSQYKLSVFPAGKPSLSSKHSNTLYSQTFPVTARRVHNSDLFLCPEKI